MSTEDVELAYENASAGSIVLLTTGTYTGTEMGSTGGGIRKPVNLQCIHNVDSCVFDGEDDRRCLYVYEVDDVTIKLITFTSGDANGGTDEDSNGGGILIKNSNVLLMLVKVTNNHAENEGGGISIVGKMSDTTNLFGCTFSSNTAVGDGNDLSLWTGTANFNGCPIGYSKVSEASMDVSVAPFSTHSGEKRSYTCQPCNIGKYQDQVDENSCISCPNGFVTVSTASSSVGDCNVCQTSVFVYDDESYCLCPTNNIEGGYEKTPTGETLVLSEGSYIGETFGDLCSVCSIRKAITIGCKGDDNCIFSGEGNHRCASVRHVNGGDAQVTFIKLKFNNGQVSGPGGALFVYDSTVDIVMSIFNNNHSGGNGGAIFVTMASSAVDIIGCSFLSNSASSGQGPDVYSNSATVNFVGCPAGHYGEAGNDIDDYSDGGTTSGVGSSYSCSACVR